jgi:hypothetical protein
MFSVMVCGRLAKPKLDGASAGIARAFYSRCQRPARQLTEG